MDKIRTLIVDDEPLAREGVRLLLQGDSQIDIVGECSSGRKAIEEILKRSPDLVFLDVQMPEVDGFEVVAGVDPARMPVVIFVTAYDRYAIRAFEVQALDYLLKPYTDARFRSVLERAKTFIAKERLAELRTRLGTFLDAHSARLSNNEPRLEGDMRDARSAPSQAARVMIKSGGRVCFLDIDEIDWIQAADYYVELHTGGKTHLLRDSLTHLEARLDPKRFFRIHRSTIINIERVSELLPHHHGNYRVILRDGTKLELSRRRRNILCSMLDRLS